MGEFLGRRTVANVLALGIGVVGVGYATTGCASSNSVNYACKLSPISPIGYKNEETIPIFKLPTNAPCSPAVFDPTSGKQVATITPGSYFYGNCINSNATPPRMQLTLDAPGNGYGWTGDVQLTAQALTTLTHGRDAMRECYIPEPSAEPPHPGN